MTTTIPEDTKHYGSDTFPIGRCAHQGDLTFIRVPALPTSATARDDRQLAEGSTAGSRHVVEAGRVFTVNPAEAAAAAKAATGLDIDPEYLGAAFATDAVTGTAIVSHPEHAWYEFTAEGAGEAMFFIVKHQRNVDAEGRIARARD